MQSLKNKPFTILTEPVTLSRQIHIFLFKRKQQLKHLLSYITSKKEWRGSRLAEYGGHYAVTRSALEGLRAIGVSFNYNPRQQKEIAQTVFVIAGSDTLEYALNLKKAGLIKKIVAGPNIAVLPDEITILKNISLLDTYVQPSKWVIDLWNKLDPHFPAPLEVWYAGVDTDFWKPSSMTKNRDSILLYKKHVSDAFFAECKEFIEKNNFAVEVICYGAYTANQYLEALHRNSAVIHFTKSESQGISLAESWATDTPTLVWNPTLESSSGPYLTKQTGAFFANSQELVALLSDWHPEKYTPRQWCLEHMSDQVSARRLLDILEK